MAKTAVQTIVNKRREKKKKIEEPEFTPEQSVMQAAATPQVTPPPTETGPVTGPPPDQLAVDQRNIARYGTANPTEGQILQALFALQQGKGDVTGFEGVRQGVTGEQFAPPEQPDLTAQQAALEEAGAFEQVTPTRTELSPEPQTPISKLPVVGPVADAIAAILLPQDIEAKEVVGGFDIPLTEETIRERALTKIRDDSFQEGITLRESFGTVVEGIPVVGAIARKYANGLIETPSANADNVIDNINKIKEAASTGQEKVRNGLESPDYGLDRARSMEEQVSQLEGRLKLLINSSPILRANTDEVNKIEEQILEAREKIARYRQASTFGLTASLTGAGRDIPTDEQIFFALRGGS